jgi:hypothetical protein
VNWRAVISAAGAIAVLAIDPSFGAEPASQRLERFASEAYERVLDLFPVGETMGRGAGPREDKLELTFTVEHRERQRAHHRWVLQQLDAISSDTLTPTEKLTHQLLAYRSWESLEWLSYPFHQHYVFI